jgi:hypothetical protein
MSQTHIPRDPPPSVAWVLVTLLVSVGVFLGSVLVGERVVRGWWGP